jgi:hypothetical protein
MESYPSIDEICLRWPLFYAPLYRKISSPTKRKDWRMQAQPEGWKLIERKHRFTNFLVRPGKNAADYEASVLSRETQSNCEEWITERISSWPHASTRAERHSISPRDLMTKLTAISRI